MPNRSCLPSPRDGPRRVYGKLYKSGTLEGYNNTMTLIDRVKSIFVKSVDSSGIASLLGLSWGTSAPDMYAKNRLLAYKSWVQACVSAIADDVADTNFRLEKKKPDGTWEKTDHDCMRLLEKPNPLQSGFDLFFAIAAYLKLDGNSFLWVLKNKGGKVAEIWPLDPSTITVKADDNGTVGSFDVLTLKGKKNIQSREMVHIKTFNPTNKYRGMGIVEAVALAIDTDEFAAKWNKNFFANSAVPSAALETEQELSKEKATLIEETWKAKHTGVDHAHKLAILHSGLKYVPTNPNQRDMQFLEQRKFSRDEILAIFRVPKMILGIVEDVNRANAEASDYIFAKRVIKPLILMVANSLTAGFLPIFGLGDGKYRIWFDDPVPQNRELEMLEDESGIKNGYLTINEVRSRRGMDEIDHGDQPLVQSTMIPLDEVSADVATRTPAGQTPAAATPAKTKEYRAMLKSATSRNSYVRKQIKSRTEVYKQIYLSRQPALLKGVKAGLKSFSKTVKKDRANAIVSEVFSVLETGWVDEFSAANTATYNEVLATAGVKSLAEVKVNGAFDVANPRARDWMASHALEGAKSVVGTIRESVRDVLTAGIANGSTIDDIAAGISEFFDGVNWRATRVARTEVISSYAEGSMEGYRQSGVVKGKAWAIIDDDRVDDECVANAEQGTIGLDDVFASGDMAPPVHPNCRCSVQPVLT